MSKVCAKCEKSVYPTEELKCLDKASLSDSLMILIDNDLKKWLSCINYIFFYRFGIKDVSSVGNAE